MPVALYAFAVGVSFAATFGSLAHLAWWPGTAERTRPSRAAAEIAIRLAYGAANVLNVLLGNTPESSLAVGVLLGGLFVAAATRPGIARTLYGVRGPRHRAFFLLTTFVLPPLTFALLVRVLNQRLILG